MPANVFAETNNNAVTAKAETGTNAESEDASIDTKAANQTGEADTKIEQEAKLAVDSLFGSKNYTALAKGVNEWRINSVEVTVEKVTDDQVKKDLQDKIELAKAFLAVNALFTANHQDLANGVTKASIDAANVKVLALVDSEGKNVLKQDIKMAKGHFSISKKNGVQKEKTLATKKLMSTKLKKLSSTKTPENIMKPQVTVIDGEKSYVINADNLDVLKDYHPTINQSIQLKYEWELPAGHTYVSGDTYTFKLPNNFKVENLQSGSLDEFGAFEVNTNNEVTFTFNQKVEGKQVTDGWFQIQTQFNNSFGNNNLNQTIDFGVPGLEKVPITFSPIPSSADVKQITKSGDYVGGSKVDTKQFKWTVTVNNQYKSLTNAIVKDSLTGNHSVDGDSIKIYKLPEAGLNGTPVSSEKEDVTSTIQPTGFPINLGNISTPYVIEYTTTVNDKAGKQYSNQATLQADSQDPVSTDNIIMDVTRKEPLMKEGSFSGTTGSWTVYINMDEAKSGELVVNDTIDNSQKLDASSVKVYKATSLDENGKPNAWGDVLPPADYEVTGDGQSTFSLKIKSAEDAPYVWKYNTVKTHAIVEDTNVKNTATFGEKEVSVTTKLNTETFIQKSHGTVDYTNKIIPWTIKANQAKSTLSDGTKITDTFGTKDMALKSGEEPIVKIGETVLTKGTDYSYSYTAPISSDPGSFEITLLKPVYDEITITYNTSFDMTTSQNNIYGNYVNIAGNADGQTLKKSTSATMTPSDSIVKNGYKTGTFDPDTRTFEWTVGVNENKNTLTNAKFEDTLPAGHTIDVSTVKVKDSSGDDVSIGNLKFENENGKLTFDFPTTFSDKYTVTYETTDSDDLLTTDNKNKAVITADGGITNTFEANVHVNMQGTEQTQAFVTKSLENVGRNLQWTLEINKSLSTLNNLVVYDVPKEALTDPLFNAQDIDQDSFELTPSNLTVNGGNVSFSYGTSFKIEKGYNENCKCTLSFEADNKGFNLKFNESVKTAYKLTYKAKYMGPLTEEAKNFAYLTFDNQDQSSNNQNSAVSQDLGFTVAAGGATTLLKGSITVKKKDKDDNKPISGVEFTLYDFKGDKIESKLTDSNGQIKFDNLDADEYSIQETKVAKGYQPDTQIKKFILNNTNLVPVVDVTNEKIPMCVPTINITLNDGADTVPNGIKFNIVTKDSEGNIVTVKDNENNILQATTNNGKINLPSLDPGKYYLELADKNSDYQITQDQLIPITEKGSDSCDATTITLNLIECDNFDIDYTGPEGSEFDLTAVDGTVLKLKAVKENDKVTLKVVDEHNNISSLPEHLEKQNYTLTQTSVPNGYSKANNQTITYKPDTCSVTLIVKVEKCDTFANFEVVGATGQQATDLASQAEFKVVDSNGDDVAGAAGLKVVDGKVNVPDLSPGTYKLVQTKAPAGYYAASPQEFVVSTDTCTSLIPVKNYPIPPTPTCPIEFNVVDSKTNNGIGNATFEVKQNGVTVATVTSDAAGKVSLPALIIGDYELVQTSSKTGYDFSKTPISFSVKNDNGTCTVTISTVKNDPKTCPVNITVIDAEATNVNVAGATFTVKDQAGKVVAENVTSDKDGKIVVNGLVAGDYTLTQTSAPTGYTKAADVSFTVKAKADVTCENTVVVVKNVPKTCDVVLVNKDADTGAVVKGSSTFIVKDQDNQIVTTVSSDSNGKITIASLKPGTYEVIQQKAPAGYEEQTDSITFTVKNGICGTPNLIIANKKVDKEEDPKNENDKEDGKTPSKTPGKGNTNDQGTKTDDKITGQHKASTNKDSKDTIFNVTDKNHAYQYKDDRYKLVDENGNTVASGLKVNKDGNIIVNGLPDGTYHLVKLPQTGSQTSLYVSLIGLAFVLMGGYVIYRSRKKHTI